MENRVLPNEAELGSKRSLRFYDRKLKVTNEYKTSLPDMQNSGSATIKGANVPILQVGISNFRLPLRYMAENGASMTLETSVTGTVSLAADKKGINMSRIMRVFYEFKDRVFSPSYSKRFFWATRSASTAAGRVSSWNSIFR